MKPICRAVKKFALGLFLVVSFSNAQAVTEFVYTSSPQSWVGAGETVSVKPSLGFVFSPSRNYDNGVSFAINDFSTNPNIWGTRWWYLDFAAPYDALLSVGNYQGATRWPFQAADSSGLDFSGNGRGNNSLTGSFDILEVNYAGDGTLLTFAADFVQYDEGVQDWWNRGSIRYNSDIPVTVASVSEPSALLLVSLALGAFVITARRRRAV